VSNEMTSKGMIALSQSFFPNLTRLDLSNVDKIKVKIIWEIVDVRK